MRLLASILVVLSLAGCDDPCKNTIVREITSPDGKFVATAFIRDCGATTDYSPQVSLRRAGERMPALGNVYIGNHSKKVDVRWLSPTHLQIEAGGEMVSEKTSFEGIAIERKEKK